MIKKGFFAAILLAAALGTAWFLLRQNQFVVEIPQQKVDETLAGMFPVSQTYYLTDIQVERFSLPGIPELHSRRVAQVVALAAEEFLQRRPIYQIEGKATQARLARMLLKDVRVEDQTLYLTLGL